MASGGTIDFGTTLVGTSVTQIVTVTNIGDTTLDLSPIDPSTLPAGFSLVSNLARQPLLQVNRLRSRCGWMRQHLAHLVAVIHLLNNDTDEGSFAIVLQGVVNNPPPPPPDPPSPPAPYVKTIDNGADGFTTTGTWHVQNGKGGFEQDIQFANKAQKKDKTFATATWNFTGLAAGPIPGVGDSAPITVICQRCSIFRL